MASERDAADAIRAGAVVSPRCEARMQVANGLVAVCSEPLAHFGPHYDRRGMYSYWCRCGWVLMPEDASRNECPACGASW